MPEEPEQGAVVALRDRARAGDDVAVDAFVRLITPVLARQLAFRLHGYPSHLRLAEDLQQETLLRVARGLRRCRGETDAQVMRWVLTVMRNTIAGWERRNLPVLLATCALRDDVTGPSRLPTEEEPEPPPDPVWATVLSLMRGAYAGLPPRSRRLVAEHLLEERTWRELAHQWDTTRAGVRRRYQRARDRMRNDFLRALMSLEEPERREVVRRLGLDPDTL